MKINSIYMIESVMLILRALIICINYMYHKSTGFKPCYSDLNKMNDFCIAVVQYNRCPKLFFFLFITAVAIDCSIGV